MRHRHRSDGREQSAAQRRAEAAHFVEGEQGSLRVRGVEQAASWMVARPSERGVCPRALGQFHRRRSSLFAACRNARDVSPPSCRTCCLSSRRQCARGRATSPMISIFPCSGSTQNRLLVVMPTTVALARVGDGMDDGFAVDLAPIIQRGSAESPFLNQVERQSLEWSRRSRARRPGR